jgi:hypothetical protein
MLDLCADKSILLAIVIADRKSFSKPCIQKPTEECFRMLLNRPCTQNLSQMSESYGFEIYWCQRPESFEKILLSNENGMHESGMRPKCLIFGTKNNSARTNFCLWHWMSLFFKQEWSTASLPPRKRRFPLQLETCSSVLPTQGTTKTFETRLLCTHHEEHCPR